MAIAGDSWVNPITLHGLVTQEYWKAIEHSRSTLPNFVASFQNRSKAQSRFLVSGLVEIGDHFVPVGVLVDRVDMGKLFGTRIENDSKAIQGEQRAEIDSEYVVDWSYVDLWELQGGELWRKVYNRLGEGQRIGAMQYIYGICQLESPPGQTAIQRSLLRSIVESDYELFEKLFREAGSPDSIPMTKYDGERHWTIHGLGYPSELVLQFSSIGFIEQSFRTIFHKSEDHMFTASCIKRPEVFEFVCELGVSAESKTSTQVTPLHIAAQSGDEYAVARLLESKRTRPGKELLELRLAGVDWVC